MPQVGHCIPNIFFIGQPVIIIIATHNNNNVNLIIRLYTESNNCIIKFSQIKFFCFIANTK